MVWVNTYRASAVQAPFGGVKDSGFGRERGDVALDEFTSVKNIMIDYSNAERDRSPSSRRLTSRRRKAPVPPLQPAAEATACTALFLLKLLTRFSVAVRMWARISVSAFSAFPCRIASTIARWSASAAWPARGRAGAIPVNSNEVVELLAQQIFELGIAAGPRDAEMEVQITGRLVIRRAVPDLLVMQLQKVVQFGQDLRRHALRRKPAGRPLERFADLKHLDDIGVRQHTDARAKIGRSRHKLAALEQPQRFSKRPAADAHLASQTGLLDAASSGNSPRSIASVSFSAILPLRVSAASGPKSGEAVICLSIKAGASHEICQARCSCQQFTIYPFIFAGLKRQRAFVTKTRCILSWSPDAPSAEATSSAGPGSGSG